MKKILFCLSLLLVSSLAFVSCSKDDDPADNDLFVGTYNGRVTTPTVMKANQTMMAK